MNIAWPEGEQLVNKLFEDPFNAGMTVNAEFIKVPERLRTINETKVEEIAKSISEIGLRTPITVRFEDPTSDFSDIVLVAGRHRLAAAIKAGLTYVPVIWFQGDATDASLWEISENLHRAELTAAERAEHIAEWIRLTDQKRVSSQVETKPRVADRNLASMPPLATLE